MLKNKKAIYILIPLNLFIWGFFIYRFYTAYAASDEPVMTDETSRFKTEDLKDSAVYQLKRNYKDPFLKDSRSARTIVAAAPLHAKPVQVNAIIKQVPSASPPKVIPEIRFLGLIKNSSSGMTAALVSVNGQSKLVKQNEVMEGVTFKSLNRDSLVAKWGNERIVVRK